jgi:hypothetical protein
MRRTLLPALYEGSDFGPRGAQDLKYPESMVVMEPFLAKRYGRGQQDMRWWHGEKVTPGYTIGNKMGIDEKIRNQQ